MDKVLQKRISLETFIREQTLGPGINGYKYVDLKDAVLVKKNLKVEPSINYDTEILDIVPAAIYSTGILFPEDKSGTCNEGLVLDNNQHVDKEDGLDAFDYQDGSLDSEDVENGLELNQMYPKTMGMTCCLSEQCLDRGDIEFSVSLRYYIKLKQDKEGKFNNKYGLLCEVDIKTISEFLSKNGLNQFSIITIEQNTFLLLAKISTEQNSEIKSTIRCIQKKYAEELYDKMNGVINLSVPLIKEKCYLSNLKSIIYYELKNSIVDVEKRNNYYSITQEIELIENITEHLINLLDVNSGGYGLWQSIPIKKIIKIKNINFPKSQTKISFLYNQPNENEDITSIGKDGVVQKGLKNIIRFDLNDQQNEYASLSANVQLSRDSRKKDSKIFLKIQLINTSTAYNQNKQKDNRYYSTFNEEVNRRAFFGVKVCLENEYLVPYSDYTFTPNEMGIYDEDTTTRFIYNQYKDYAVGHGCSVKWDTARKKVETEYLPECETPDIDPIPRDKSKLAKENAEGDFRLPLFLENSQSQEFKWLSVLSDAKDDEVINGLLAFVESYSEWIENKKCDSKYHSQLKDIATQELDKCEQDYLRMKMNIQSLMMGENNKENLSSFRLMNTAMFMQLWHSEKVKKNEVSFLVEHEKFSLFDLDFYKNTDDKLFSKTESAGWRAFQLAFILLNLDGIFKTENDENWTRRNEWVDLVWFPTGGGKTEAYLGLIALTIINRRKLYKEEGGGVASIMRYTLRLLTMQQFQRASLVIMALELIRRWDLFDLGKEPITIGLWVGGDSLPNKTEDLIIEYNKLNINQPNKVPFSCCPWCGSNIEGEDKMDNENLENRENQWFANKVHLICSNNKCSFSYPKRRARARQHDQGPLPVCLSDEIIYQHPPTLLFGTVDKFAQLAHKVNGTDIGRNADSRRLFGRGNWEQGKPMNGYLPPDLIIQDELHLLLGPLGSAVALFESAIDQLCTREDGTRPKIISSTATTRNTQLQIFALFDRKVDLFPKPGVECDDSFFAFYSRNFKNREKKDEVYISKRKYIGVLPTGRTQIWMQMRLAAIILTHRAIFELKELLDNSLLGFNSYNMDFETAMDSYHTTISYFNSLKEVGKTQSQVQTYILKELRRVFNRVIRPQKLMHSLYTYGPLCDAELTGRLSGEEVKNELRNVETKWIAQSRFANLKDDRIESGKVPPEFVVATNMISVGIDVSRFNTIIMNSMPRNTAEYIQASSRVARKYYGLVLTVHHPFRARDVSHYEKFIEFHEKMYSYVEPISITPFTKKSVERYMGLYLATMIRHTTRFTERNSAGNISSISDKELSLIISRLFGYFEKRKNRLSNAEKYISNLLKQENVDQIGQWINEAFREWKNESNKVLSDDKIFVFNNKSLRAIPPQEQLYVDIEEYEGNIHSKKWQVPMSLRVIEPEAAIKIYSI